MSTESTTPVERARARLARAVADDLYAGSTTGDVYDVTVRCEGETFRDLAERIGSIAADSLEGALSALLDRDEIARVLDEHSALLATDEGCECGCGVEITASIEDYAVGTWRTHQADALIAHLTGAQA